jgi:tetratricopeptide (TPR) repeat protein
MRIESLRAQLNQFPDFDGFWVGTDLQAIEETIRKGGDSVEALVQLARVLDLQEKEQEAQTALTNARKLFLENRAKSPQTEIRLLIEEGRHLCLAMTPNRAQGLFGQASNIANRTNDDFFSVEASVLLSLTVPPKEQTAWLKQAVSIAEKSHNDLAKLWLAHVHIFMGWNSFDMRQFDQALSYFELAKTNCTQSQVRVDLVALQWSIARCLRALHRLPEALGIQQENAQLRNSGYASGFIFLEIAECLQLLKKHNEAKEFFEKAHAELSQNSWYADNRVDELLRMKHLAKKSGR